MKKEILAVVVIILGFALIQTLQLGGWSGTAPGNTLLQANDETFGETVAQAQEVTLVKFWAPWCGACRKLMPTVKEIAAERESDLSVIAVNVDEAPRTSASFGVGPIPCLILLKNGREVDRMIGVQPKPVLTTWIDGTLSRYQSVSHD